MYERFARHTLSLLVLGACSLNIAAGPAEDLEEKRIESQPGDTLVVENDYGRVRITAWDQSTIEVRIRKIATEEANLENVYVLSQKNGSKVFLRAFFYDYEAESLYLDIQAPDYLNVVVWGVNPAIDIAGLRGRVKVHTITGFIRAENLLASSSLATEEGNIQYLSTIQPAEDIRLESFRGNINCAVEGSLNLRGWLRAGKTLSWNDELILSPGTLEKQMGIGGPLILAASSEGNVSFSLRDQALAQTDGQGSFDPQSADAEIFDAPQETNSNEDRTGHAPGENSSASRVPVSSTSASSANGGYALKVNVDWIYVNASVRDRYTNRAVPDLVKQDFEVFEEGSLQKIEQFESTEAPFSLLLLLDVSGSTKSYMGMIKDAAVQFIEEIKTNDRIAVATFNSRTRLVQDFTGDRGRAKSAVGRIRSGGGTAFYDALDRSVREYMDSIEGRKAIVVFSDGVDNQLTGDYGSGSRTTFPDLYREVQEADTLIYTIFLDTEGQRGMSRGGRRRGGLGGILGDIIFKGPSVGIPGGGGWGQDRAYAEARRELELIANQTGGRMYAPRTANDLFRIYTEVANDLRVQYTIGYHSQGAANNGQWREIEVRIINRPDLTVRARRGYYGRKG
jgi:VWFA-related protein